MPYCLKYVVLTSIIGRYPSSLHAQTSYVFLCEFASANTPLLYLFVTIEI